MRNFVVSGIIAIMSTGALAKTSIVCNKGAYKVYIDAENVTTASGAKESHFVVFKNGSKVLEKNFVTFEQGYNAEVRAYVWGFKNNNNEQIGVGTREMPNNTPAPGMWSSKARAKIVTPAGTFSAGSFGMAACAVTISN